MIVREWNSIGGSNIYNYHVSIGFSGSKPDETNHIQGYVEKGLAIDRRMYLYRI